MILQTPAASAAEFDIPLSELNKVKKKYPAKAESSKRRKQSKKQQQPSQAEQNPTSSNTESAAGETGMHPQEKSAETPASATLPASTTKSSITPETSSIRISHTPYSFLVPGKRTTVQAVISSDTTISNVYCYFHSAGTVLGAAVSMSKVAGTRFTYSTVIPALNSESSGLSYKIYAVDSNGVTSQSKEYTIPASSTAISPGWQTDNFKDTLNIQQDKPNTVLYGFSDPALSKQ